MHLFEVGKNKHCPTHLEPNHLKTVLFMGTQYLCWSLFYKGLQTFIKIYK